MVGRLWSILVEIGRNRQNSVLCYSERAVSALTIYDHSRPIPTLLDSSRLFSTFTPRSNVSLSTMPQKKLTSVIDIVDKLVDVSIAIKNRGKLKDPEEARVGDAFALLAAGRPPPGCPGEANKSRYLEFLLRVKQFMGPAGVVISAAGLGVSAVAGMRDRLRVDLPVKMKERERQFAKTELETIACIFSAKSESF